MSISGFAYRIGVLSSPQVVTVNAARRAMRTASVPLIAAAIALGAPPAIAQEREQVKVAFEHALPNVDGKRMVAVTVTYPPGGKSSPCSLGIHLRLCIVRRHPQPGRQRAREGLSSR